jgi:cytochrome c-type biogenesis protein CcmF
LSFFGVVAVLSIGLIMWRGDRLRSPGSIDSPVSRESAFFANNVIFGALAFIVLLGTVFPLLAEAYDGTRLSIGRPYFDSMARPIAFVMLFLMAAAPVLPWRKASTELLSERLFWPAVAALASMVAAIVFGGRGFYPVLTFGLGGFAAGAALRQVILATRRQGWRGFVGRTNGGMIVHLGVVMIAVAVAGSESYKTDRLFTMLPGDEVEVAGHTFEYLDLEANQNDRRIHIFANIQIDGDEIYTPGSTIFRQLGTPVATPSVRPGFTEDLFLVLDRFQDDPNEPISLRIIVRPLMSWMWVGGGMMGLGSVLALFPGKRRRGTEPVSALLGAGGNSEEPLPSSSAPGAGDPDSTPEPAHV